MVSVSNAYRNSTETAENAQYAIPLGYRKRTLFKMDFAEVVYISELRTGPAGHISYRSVAYAMFSAYPQLRGNAPAVILWRSSINRWTCGCNTKPSGNCSI